MEAATGHAVATWLTDRRAAGVVRQAVRDWVEAAMGERLDAFPCPETHLGRDEVLTEVTAKVWWHLICRHFGEARAIEVRNLILRGAALREEFLPEDPGASPRDFSFLLTAVDAGENRPG